MTGPGGAAKDAVAAVEAYLGALGRGDSDSAAAHLGRSPVLEFPGGRTFGSLADLGRGLAGRYRWIDKHRDRYETAVQADGRVLVLSLGRLFGENLHGVAFDGVRYVDVFTLRDGLIVEQLVFNDLRETGVLDAVATDGLLPAFRPSPL